MLLIVTSLSFPSSIKLFVNFMQLKLALISAILSKFSLSKIIRYRFFDETDSPYDWQPIMRSSESMPDI